MQWSTTGHDTNIQPHAFHSSCTRRWMNRKPAVTYVCNTQGWGVVVVLFRPLLWLRLRLRVWWHFTLDRSNDQKMKLKEIDQRVRYRKSFKSLYFVVASMLVRKDRRRRCSRKVHLKILFGNCNKWSGVGVEVVWLTRDAWLVATTPDDSFFNLVRMFWMGGFRNQSPR